MALCFFLFPQYCVLNQILCGATTLLIFIFKKKIDA